MFAPERLRLFFGITFLSAKEKKATNSGPQDRYISPEMKSYTSVFRFGHFLLVPTAIGKVPGKLFMIDTGGFHESHHSGGSARGNQGAR